MDYTNTLPPGWTRWQPLPEGLAESTTSDPIPGPDRRRERRQHLWGLPEVRFLLKPSFRPHRAVLLDLSAGGLALLTTYPLDAGSVLAVQLAAPDRRGMLCLLVEVRHVTELDSGGWQCGCAFRQHLPEEEALDLCAAAILARP